MSDEELTAYNEYIDMLIEADLEREAGLL